MIRYIRHMSNPKRISQKALQILMQRETYYESPTNVDGVYYIGHNFCFHEDGEMVNSWDLPTTPKRARMRLENFLRSYESTVASAVKIKISQNQFDALVLLCYDIGIKNFLKSNLLKHINGTLPKNLLDIELMCFCSVYIDVSEEEGFKKIVFDDELTQKRVQEYKMYVHGVY